ncbi:MAG: hypothetical protein N2Z74_00095, partial [Syntrophales bacterium]|nr:hypothetical protein [Syntrophales bacterium]
GLISGAKQYLHMAMNWAALEALVAKTDKTDKLGYSANALDYTHELRNYAQVCREGLNFFGTVGAENCTSDEIAALLLVLDSRFAHHGFKIGLGKPLGLGSVSSRIQRLWLRRPDDYQWECFDLAPGDEAPPLPVPLAEAQKRMQQLKTAHDAVFSLNKAAQRLEFPAPGQRYWDNFLKAMK